MKKIVIFLLLLLIIISCKHSTSPDENPEWVTKLIAKYESEPVGNPPRSIWRYEYKCQTVYYVPPQCCDQYSILFDVNGKRICAPDGGITGRGDGKCPDFFQNRKKEKLIWKDTRNP